MLTIVTRGLTFSFALISLGCVSSVSTVQSLPQDVGLEASYRASIDDVGRGVIAAFGAERQDLVERLSLQAGTVMYIGARGSDFLNTGVATRVLMVEQAEDATQVRAVSRGNARAFRVALHTVQSLDSIIGPERTVPVVGMRARGEPRDRLGTLIVGTVARGFDGALELVSSDPALSIPMESLASLEGLRGSYGRAGEGVGFGVLAGIVVFVQNERGQSCGLWSVCEPGVGLGAIAIGGLVGAVIGHLIRTEVWSGMSVSLP